MKIYFLIPYPLGEAPSQRFRFEQYLKALSDQGHATHIQSFLNYSRWKLFFKKGKNVSKIISLINGFSKRIIALIEIPRYDFVFIHREATPLGPPVFEWIIVKILRKKVIYDFDDAIWLTDRKDESILLQKVKWRSKVAKICRWSYKVSCGNDYLSAYAARFNKNVVYNPTTIDTVLLHNRELYSERTEDKIIVGWTGSHSTLKYLSSIESVLQQIENKYLHVEFWVISDEAPELRLKRFHFKPWSLKTEISDLAQFSIGVMPLPDDAWAKGKCGFKALQYMALEIATLASPVGVNTHLIEDGKNGFLCLPGDWQSRLEMLIEQPILRQKIARQGKTTVEKHFSLDSNTSNFLSLFS